MKLPRPTNIVYHQKTRQLEISFDDDTSYEMSAEYLRVNSPSAEVQGHGPGQDVLQVGKENVAIAAIKPVGHYAIQIVFDDEHDTGIYAWDTLHQLGANQQENWEHYLERLKEAGHQRTMDS